MIKVALLGTVGAGKDTLSRLVSAKLTRLSPRKGKRCKVRDIQEFSVLWTDKTGGTKEVFEQFWIWYKQKQWDHDYDSRNDDPLTFVISAAPSPLAYFYALSFADMTDRKHRLLLEDLYGKAIAELLAYDIIFYLPLEFKIPDGDRLRKKTIRRAVDLAIQAFLLNHRFSFIELRGPEDKRAQKAFRVLKNFLKKKLENAPVK